MILLLALTAAHAQACDTPTTRDALGAEIGAAELAFAKVDWTALGARADALVEMVPCANARLLPGDLAPVFRIRGWALFAAGDPAAWSWLATASGLQPRHVYDPPLRGPMATAWASAGEKWAEASSAAVALEPADGGELLVNGSPASAAPRTVPWVLQHLGSDGAVRGTWLVQPSGAVPAYPRAPVAPEVVEVVAPVPPPLAVPPPSERHRSRPLAVAGGVSLGLGAVGLGAAHATKQSYKRTGDIGLKGPNAAAGAAGFGLLGLGTALGAVAVVKGEW